MIKHIAVAASLVLLAACDTIDEDTTAGRTKVEATFYNPAELPADVAKLGPSPREITWYDGKDKANVNASLDMNKGVMTYSASDVVATDPQAVEARMRQALGDDVTNSIKAALPDGLSTLVKALFPAGVP